MIDLYLILACDHQLQSEKKTVKIRLFQKDICGILGYFKHRSLLLETSI